MPEELKNLIDKIQEEGVQAAEEKAAAIEKEAQKQAEKIVKNASDEAKELMSAAKEEISKMEKSANDALTQSGRDLLLNLRQEINNILARLTALHVRDALSGGELTKIVHSIIKETKDKETPDITITLKKSDCENLEKTLFPELKDKAKQSITLKTSDDITGGFTISYDSGKSLYDFTDKALAEYISASLRPALGEILNKASKNTKK